MNTNYYEDKYISIVWMLSKPKTEVYKVVSKCSNCILGVIEWNPNWRHYWFRPTIEIETGHSDRCLFTIGNFIKTLNKEHKNKPKVTKYE